MPSRTATSKRGKEAASAKSSPLVTLLDTAIVLERGIERRMAEVGLSVAQQRVLSFLYIAREKLTPTLLGALLLQKAHSISSLVSGMEQRGLVERHYDPKDRRLVWVELTPAGRKAAEAAIGVELEVFKRFGEVLSEPEAEAMVAMLRKIRTIAFTLADFPEQQRAEGVRRVWGRLPSQDQ